MTPIFRMSIGVLPFMPIFPGNLFNFFANMVKIKLWNSQLMFQNFHRHWEKLARATNGHRPRDKHSRPGTSSLCLASIAPFLLGY